MAPFVTLAPTALAPVLLSCEHAANRFPSRTPVCRAERALLASHRGWDIGAWKLTRELAVGLETSAVGGRWTRTVIDLNRPVGDPTLIPAVVDGLVLSWNRRLSIGEVERRVREYHAPYHTEIDRLIERRLLRGIRPLLLAIHSFTPRLTGGRSRPFDVGVLYEHHGTLAHRL